MDSRFWLGLVLGLISAIIILGIRGQYASKHKQQFFVIKQGLSSSDRKKREVNLYTWNIFGILIGLLFVITTYYFKESFSAVTWGFFIGFLLLFMGIGGSILLIKELKK